MKKLIPVLLITALLSACASGRYSAGYYDGRSAQQIERIQTGTITGMTPVTIHGQSSGLGGLAGGAAGAVAAGSLIGRGNGALLAGIGGAVIGAVAGSALEGGANQHNAIRITLKLDSNKETIAITQELTDAERALRIGDRVNIATGSGPARVYR